MSPKGLDPGDLTAGVADIEAARIALRWALERIRALEASRADAARRSQEEKEAFEAAKGAVEASRGDVERRGRLLGLREGFVADMRRLLSGREDGEAARLRVGQERERLEDELSLARDAAIGEVEAAKAAEASSRRAPPAAEVGAASVRPQEPLRAQAGLRVEHLRRSGRRRPAGRRRGGFRGVRGGTGRSSSRPPGGGGEARHAAASSR